MRCNMLFTGNDAFAQPPIPCSASRLQTGSQPEQLSYFGFSFLDVPGSVEHFDRALVVKIRCNCKGAVILAIKPDQKQFSDVRCQNKKGLLAQNCHWSSTSLKIRLIQLVKACQ